MTRFIKYFSITLILALILPACAPAASALVLLPATAPTSEPQMGGPGASIPNPASVNCIEKGGVLDIRSGEAGETGVCVFPDGSECDEWALYRNECAPKTPSVTTYPAAFYNPSPEETELSNKIASGYPEKAFEGIAVVPIKNPAGSDPLWAVFSYGLINYELEPFPQHFVAVYTRDSNGWKEIGKYILGSSDPLDDTVPGYIDLKFFQQPQFDQKSVWLVFPGGAGAHSGTFHMLRFDGKTLKLALPPFFTAGPGAVQILDLNMGGEPEIFADFSDAYIFCYACMVRSLNFEGWRFDDALNKMVKIKLTEVGFNTPVEIRNPVNQAVALAKSGLWSEAQDILSTIKGISTLKRNDPAVWNTTLIAYYVMKGREYASFSSYPLLQNVFVGDYDKTIDLMRKLEPKNVFSANTPLIKGTDAEPFKGELIKALKVSTNAAIIAKPDLAGAYFLRGWATFIENPKSIKISADVKKAASLSPDDTFLQACADLYK